MAQEQEYTLIFKDFDSGDEETDNDDELLSEKIDSTVNDKYTISVEELNDARDKANMAFPTPEPMLPLNETAIVSYGSNFHLTDTQILIGLSLAMMIAVMGIAANNLKRLRAKPPRGRSSELLESRPNHPVLRTDSSTNPVYSILCRIQCALDVEQLSIQEIVELCAFLTEQSNLLDIDQFQSLAFYSDLSQYDRAVKKIHEVQVQLFSEHTNEGPSLGLDFEIEGCGFRRRLLACKRAAAAALIAVERTEGRWKVQQEVARMEADIARLQGDIGDANQIPIKIAIIKYMTFLEEAAMTESPGYGLARQKLQQLRAQEDARDRESLSGALTCSSMASYQASFSPVRMLEPHSPSLEGQIDRDRDQDQDIVLVIGGGGDGDGVDRNPERGGEVVRLSPAHTPGSEVSEMLFGLLWASQQQQASSEQQKKAEARAQQEQLAKEEVRREWKAMQDRDRERNKTLNAEEMALQGGAARELGALSDRLATLKRERSRRKNSLLAADRWMLSGLLAVAVALTAHWLRLLDLRGLLRLDAAALRDLLLSALRLLSAALSSSADLSIAAASPPGHHLEWCGNGSSSSLLCSWLPSSLSLRTPLSLTPFLPTAGYSVGWRSLADYALRSLATAAAGVFGGEAALWAEAAQCLALVLKRSLPAILVKSGFSYIGFSMFAADMASWPVMLALNADVLWRLLGSLRWLVAIAFAHVVFVELLVLLDSGEDAPLQWKLTPLRAEDLVLLVRHRRLAWSVGSAADFRRPLIITLYYFFLAAVVLVSFLIFNIY